MCVCVCVISYLIPCYVQRLKWGTSTLVSRTNGDGVEGNCNGDDGTKHFACNLVYPTQLCMQTLCRDMEEEERIEGEEGLQPRPPRSPPSIPGHHCPVACTHDHRHCHRHCHCCRRCRRYRRCRHYRRALGQTPATCGTRRLAWTPDPNLDGVAGTVLAGQRHRTDTAFGQRGGLAALYWKLLEGRKGRTLWCRWWCRWRYPRWIFPASLHIRRPPPPRPAGDRPCRLQAHSAWSPS